MTDRSLTTTPGGDAWTCGHVAGAACAECHHLLAAKAAALQAEVDLAGGIIRAAQYIPINQALLAHLDSRPAARTALEFLRDRLADFPIGRDFGISLAEHDVLTERRRQRLEEGFDDAHDDCLPPGTLSAAANFYCTTGHVGLAVGLRFYLERHHHVKAPGWWPWSETWWKPKDPRRDLVRAAALIVAEIDRLDRARAQAAAGDSAASQPSPSPVPGEGRGEGSSF